MNNTMIRISESHISQNKSSGVLLKELLLYVILIPYLHPRGFDESLPWYKTFFTLWLYLSIIIILIIIILSLVKNKGVFKKSILYMLIYYLLVILITLFVQNGFSSGLQKMFATPVLCVFCFIWLQKNSASFIRVVSNILIFSFFLNVTLFNPGRMLNYISSPHINFLGHVQVSAPVGLLGIYLSFIMIKRFPNYKFRAAVLCILSIICMIVSATDASYYCLFILLGSLILSLIKPLRKLFCIDSRVYVIAFALLSVLLLFFQIQYHFFKSDSGIDLTFNGRVFIWNQAISLMRSHIFFGYGVEGVIISTFWGGAMNYAHNDLLQNLLDGGIMLCGAFYAMLLSYTSYVKKCPDQSVVFFTNIILIAYLFVMLFESVTEYFFVFFFLSLIVHLTDIFNSNSASIQKRMKSTAS